MRRVMNIMYVLGQAGVRKIKAWQVGVFLFSCLSVVLVVGQ